MHALAVRRALAMPASQFSVTDIPQAAQWEAVLETIRESVVPDALHVDAELDKLTVHLHKDHFATRRDTPGDPAPFGTLVVCLPLVFPGGHLHLQVVSARLSDPAIHESRGCREGPARLVRGA